MIYVFKTSLRHKKQIKQLSVFLDGILGQNKWNFDLDDCDNILRIESKCDIVEMIIDGFNSRGFQCTELE